MLIKRKLKSVIILRFTLIAYINFKIFFNFLTFIILYILIITIFML